jgi:hypothetical protein
LGALGLAALGAFATHLRRQPGWQLNHPPATCRRCARSNLTGLRVPLDGGAPHRCKAASGRPLLFLKLVERLRMGENCNPACRGIRRQANELLDLSSSDRRLTRAHHRAWGLCQTAAIGKSAESKTRMPRRPARLTRADVARMIRAAKQAAPARRIRTTGTPCRSYRN